MCDLSGRAICFTTGEPSGLSKTLPAALAELRAVTGADADADADAEIMLGFGRGGAYPSVFTACRAANVDSITYRRAPLATPTGLPITPTPKPKPSRFVRLLFNGSATSSGVSQATSWSSSTKHTTTSGPLTRYRRSVPTSVHGRKTSPAQAESGVDRTKVGRRAIDCPRTSGRG